MKIFLFNCLAISALFGASAEAAIRIGGIAFDNPLTSGGSSESCPSVVTQPKKAYVSVNSQSKAPLTVYHCRTKNSACTKYVLKAGESKLLKGALTGSCRTTRQPVYIKYENYINKKYQPVYLQLTDGGIYQANINFVGSGYTWQIKKR